MLIRFDSRETFNSKFNSLRPYKIVKLNFTILLDFILGTIINNIYCNSWIKLNQFQWTRICWIPCFYIWLITNSLRITQLSYMSNGSIYLWSFWTVKIFGIFRLNSAFKFGWISILNQLSNQLIIWDDVGITFGSMKGVYVIAAWFIFDILNAVEPFQSTFIKYTHIFLNDRLIYHGKSN